MSWSPASGRAWPHARAHAVSRSTSTRTVVWRSSASRIRGEVTAPPPSAITPPSARSSSAHTSRSSASRNAASPWRAKYDGMLSPSSSSSSASESAAVSPSAAAASRAAVDFPAAMKPMKTSAGLSGATTRAAPLAQRLGGLARGDVDRPQRLRQRRQRLHRRADHERLARRHPALEAARAVRLAIEAALIVVEDLVVGLGARAPRDVEPVAERDALARLDRADRAGQATVEALLPADVRAEAGDDAERDHLEDAADRLVRLPLAVDVLDPPAAPPGVQAPDRGVV